MLKNFLFLLGTEMESRLFWTIMPFLRMLQFQNILELFQKTTSEKEKRGQQYQMLNPTVPEYQPRSVPTPNARKPWNIQGLTSAGNPGASVGWPTVSPKGLVGAIEQCDSGFLESTEQENSYNQVSCLKQLHKHN